MVTRSRNRTVQKPKVMNRFPKENTKQRGFNHGFISWFPRFIGVLLGKEQLTPIAYFQTSRSFKRTATVDGINFAAVGSRFITLFIGFHPSQWGARILPIHSRCAFDRLVWFKIDCESGLQFSSKMLASAVYLPKTDTYAPAGLKGNC